MLRMNSDIGKIPVRFDLSALTLMRFPDARPDQDLRDLVNQHIDIFFNNPERIALGHVKVSPAAVDQLLDRQRAMARVREREEALHRASRELPEASACGISEVMNAAGEPTEWLCVWPVGSRYEHFLGWGSTPAEAHSKMLTELEEALAEWTHDHEDDGAYEAADLKGD